MKYTQEQLACRDAGLAFSKESVVFLRLIALRDNPFHETVTNKMLRRAGRKWRKMAENGAQLRLPLEEEKP